MVPDARDQLNPVRYLDKVVARSGREFFVDGPAPGEPARQQRNGNEDCRVARAGRHCQEASQLDALKACSRAFGRANLVLKEVELAYLGD